MADGDFSEAFLSRANLLDLAWKFQPMTQRASILRLCYVLGFCRYDTDILCDRAFHILKKVKTTEN